MSDREEVFPDPAGMFETRRRRGDGPYQADDDPALLDTLLADLERELSSFWSENGFPARPAPSWRLPGGDWQDDWPAEPPASPYQVRRHPAQHEPEGTWPKLAWDQWCLLEEVRRALDAGNIHRFGRMTFILGRKQAEVAAAVRFGQDVKSGRALRAAQRAGGEAKKLDEAVWEEILAYDAQLRRAHPGMSRSARAVKINRRHPKRSVRSIREKIPA